MNKIISVMLILFFITGLFVTVLSSVLASELVEDSWNTKTPMKQGRLDLGAVAANGKIYAIGGYADTIGFVGTNERYDPVTDKWVTLTSMPTPRNAFAIVAYQNKIYCIGGGTNGSLSVNEVYDVTTDSWNTIAPLPVNEYFIQAHIVDGKICVVSQLTLYMYDPVEDSWANKTSTPTQGIHAFSAVVDNKLIIIDQVVQDSYYDYNIVRFIATMKVMIYDPKIDVWTEGQTSPEYYSGGITDMMRPIVAGATTGVYAPEKIYTILGTSSYVYDPVENTWTIATGPSTSVTSYGVAVVDDLLYAFGGIHHPHVENIQYVPVGHKNAVPAPTSSVTPEPSNPNTTVPVTPTPNPITTPEPTDPSKPNLIYIITIAVLALTIGTVTISYFYISKKISYRLRSYQTVSKVKV
ncbi:MAG: hypothetical protein LBC12_05510 [Nitrososphaerota archaeon]|nr:hypothetical protein [Nitrososphaerota archaeon]